MKHIQTKACREADKRAPYTAATRNKLGCWLREPQQPAKECTDEESDHWPEHIYWWRNELPGAARHTLSSTSMDNSKRSVSQVCIQPEAAGTTFGCLLRGF